MKEARNYKIDHRLNPRIEDFVYYLHEYDLDLKSNHIYLFGIEGYVSGAGPDCTREPGVEYVMANRFIRNFNLCMRTNAEKAIVIHQKTNGGSWEEGMAIYDTIRSCPWPVTILNYTHARSMSSIIFQAANKRVMMPHSHFMFHRGTLNVEGTTTQVKSIVAFDRHADSQMLDIYAKAMMRQGKYEGKSEKAIKGWLNLQMDKKEDVFLTAPQCVEVGLADEIFDYNWERLTQYTDEQLKR